MCSRVTVNGVKTRTSEVRAREGFWHKQLVNTTPYKHFLWRELFITRKTRIFIEAVFLTQLKRNSRAWSRKLAINMSRSLAPIFSVSLSCFLQTKIFLSNERDMSLWFAYCVLVFLMLYKLVKRATNRHKSRAFLCLCHLRRKILKEAPLKMPPNLKSYLNVNNSPFWLALERPLRYPWLVTFPHVKQLYVILFSCMDRLFSRVKIKRIDFYKIMITELSGIKFPCSV